MKPFECDACRNKVKPQDAVVVWNLNKPGKKAGFFMIMHNSEACINKKKDGFFNRALPLEYVFKNMPEFMAYISRFDPAKKELKDFIHRIEKDRSYIRRHNVDKKEVKKLIIRMDGLEGN